MTARAYYNEIDPYAADWLENLIAAGHIAPGVVDRRSIVDVRPSDLDGFTQCHFFAGIGVWSHALRRAGWPDERPVWTGSCPCQPFSAAGKGDGFDDERHLWPHFHWLISQCRPDVVLGEQVASKDGLGWLDLVQADMEGAGYAVGALDTCAAGFGAPHIRQRLYWIGERVDDAASSRYVRTFEDAEGNTWDEARLRVSGAGGGFGGVGDARSQSGERHSGTVSGPEASGGGSGRADGNDSNRYSDAGVSSRLADDLLQQRSDRQPGKRVGDDASRRVEGPAAATGFCRDLRPVPTNGFWGAADWLFCRDGKWRPVEPGTFPLAHGATARVGRLRAYGNAIVPQVAAEVIAAYMEASLLPPPSPVID